MIVIIDAVFLVEITYKDSKENTYRGQTYDKCVSYYYDYVPEVLVKYDHRYLDPGDSVFQEMLLDHDVHQETGDIEKRIDYVHAGQNNVRPGLVQLSIIIHKHYHNRTQIDDK